MNYLSLSSEEKIQTSQNRAVFCSSVSALLIMVAITAVDFLAESPLQSWLGIAIIIAGLSVAIVMNRPLVVLAKTWLGQLSVLMFLLVIGSGIALFLIGLDNL